MKLFILHPGRIVSKNDGQIHMITFTQLCELYRLSPGEAYNADDEAHMRGLNPGCHKHLWPRHDGNYVRPCKSMGCEKPANHEDGRCDDCWETHRLDMEDDARGARPPKLMSRRRRAEANYEHGGDNED